MKQTRSENRLKRKPRAEINHKTRVTYPVIFAYRRGGQPLLDSRTQFQLVPEYIATSPIPFLHLRTSASFSLTFTFTFTFPFLFPFPFPSASTPTPPSLLPLSFPTPALPITLESPRVSAGSGGALRE